MVQSYTASQFVSRRKAASGRDIDRLFLDKSLPFFYRADVVSDTLNILRTESSLSIYSGHDILAKKKIRECQRPEALFSVRQR